jgi:Rod binding domain-containing protein
MPQVGDLVTANANQSLSQAKAAQVMSQAKAAQKSSDNPQLEKTAKAFESILLAKWLEEAQKSFATVPGDDPDKENQDPGADQYQNLALQSVAESITASGGVGIAKMIMRQLAPKNVSQSQAVDSSAVNQQSTKGELPTWNTTKVLPGKDR